MNSIEISVLFNLPSLYVAITRSLKSKLYAFINKTLKSNYHTGKYTGLAILTSWGQTSYYELVHRSCVILLSLCQDDSLRTRVLKAEVESRVEAEIHQLLQSPSLFANTVKWCKRIWHYGFQWEKNRSQLLALSDESVLHSNLPRFSAATITILNEQSEQKGIKQAQPFINLLAEVVRSTANSTAKELLGKTKQTLFGTVAPPPALILAELASKPVGAHV